jgi:hypothetical protein
VTHSTTKSGGMCFFLSRPVASGDRPFFVPTGEGKGDVMPLPGRPLWRLNGLLFVEQYLATHPKVPVITDRDGTQGLTSAEALRYNNWIRRQRHFRGGTWRMLREKIIQAESTWQGES